MDIIRQQQDEQDPAIWYAKIGGIAGDGLYRLADLTLNQELATWLAAHPVEAQAAIDAGIYNADFATRRQWFADHADRVDVEIVRIVRALVERSVRGGPQPGDVVNTQPGGSELVYDPATARAANLPVPGLQPGQQLSQGRGLSPRDAVRAGQQPIPARREVTPEVTPAPDQAAAAIAAAVQQSMAPVVAQIGQALAAAVANASRQPVTRSAQPGRSIALNTGPGSYSGMPASYNRAIVELSLGREHSVIPAPKPRLKNCVELYQEDKLRVTLRNGIW